MRDWLTPIAAVLFVAGIGAIGNATYTNTPSNQFTGAVACGQLPALTGNVTSSGCATTIAPAVVANSNLANMANSTMKCRATSGTGVPEDCNSTQIITILGFGSSASGSTLATPLSTGTPADIHVQSLSGGTWDTQCTAKFNPNAATTTTELVAELSLTSVTMPLTLGNYFSSGNYTFATSARNTVFTTPTVRYTFGTTTSVFCVAKATFGTNVMTADGLIFARKVF